MFRNGGYKDSPPLGDGKYCGDTAPLVPESDSNRVFISYYAMPITQGVILKYEEVDFDCKHDIVLGPKMSNFTISTPNYPQAPSTPHISCTWTIRAPPGESIQIDFINRFDLKPSSGCKVEYIELRDGGTEISPLIGLYCFTTPPSTVSQGNRMFIKYFTDTDSPNNGFSAIVKIATCGGTYFDQGQVTVTSPQYPSKYSPNLECLWRIVGLSVDYQLHFNITELLLGEDDNCEVANDYIEFVTVDPVTKNISDIAQSTRLCGRLLPGFNGTTLVPPSSTNEMYVRFHSGPSDPTQSKLRFSMTVTTKRRRCYNEINSPSGVITSPGYPNPLPTRYASYCIWNIIVPKDRRVSIKMLDIDLEPSKEATWAEYKIMFYHGSPNYMFMGSVNSFPQGEIIDSDSNSIKINYYEQYVTGAHRGFKAEFSSDKPLVCGGEIGDSGSTSFSALGQNRTYYYCEWTHTRDLLADNQTTFTVIINGTLNNDSSGVCTTYNSILIHTGTTKVEKTIGQICEDTKAPIAIRNPFPTTTILARKRGTIPRKGQIIPPSTTNFSITFKTDQCGGAIEGPTATISSPGFPEQYTSNLDCAWVVYFQPNTKIHVNFVLLDLDVDCTNDYLRLYNGETQMQPHLTTTLCGNNRPSTLITQSNTMFIEFHSGTASNGPHKGFNILLTEDSIGCGGTLHSADGRLQSPNYGVKSYPMNIECDWTITLPPGYHAGLTFLDRFSITTSQGCVNDYIQIFDWLNEKWEQIGNNICGRTAPTGLKTTTNKLRVLFRTNSSTPNDGFKLSWNKLCGGIIDVKGDGTIISPNYPKQYHNLLKCNYTLLAPNKTIYGRFEDFNVEETFYGDGNRCKYDNVSITTFSTVPRYLQMFMPSWMQNRYQTPNQFILCGSQIPEPVFSYNKMELIFATDPYLTTKGFLFSYSFANCGGNITSPTVITNPNNTHFRNCTWFVTAPDDKVVVVKILKINNYYGMCRNKGLQLYDGHNITNTSSLIDTVCSTFAPRRTRYISSENKMAIHYYAQSFLPMIFQAAIGFTYGQKHKCGGTIQTADLQLPYILQAPDVDGNHKYESLLYCDWLVLAPQSHQIKIKFDQMDVQNCTTNHEICTCDFIEIYDGDSQTSDVIGKYCGTASYPDVISSSGSLLIHFYSDGTVEQSGFQLSISTFLSPCGPIIRNASRELQLLQSPEYPHPSTGSSQMCMWHIVCPPRGNGLLSLQFRDLDLPSPCSHNYIEIKEKLSIQPYFEERHFIMDSRVTGAPIKLCGNRTTSLTFNRRSVQIRFVSSRATSHRGFLLEYAMKGCSGNYTTPFGRLVASQIFQNYGDGSCHNLIQVPQSNATLSLYFNAFMCIEGGYSRESAKMTVYDGPNDQAEEIATFCTTRRPNPIFSSGPALFIKFQSLSRIGKFDITYTSTDKGRGCGGTLSDFSGSFSSPLYPATYNQDSSCRWDVSVPHGNKLYFDFIYFDLGQSHTCNTNYIQFYDVDIASGAETMHSQYCGQDKPARIQMNTDTGFVRYVTTSHNNGTGWVLTWSAQPNHNLLRL